MQKKVYNFTVVIEKDEDGYYVGSVLSLKGCHTQGKTIDELLNNIKEAIELYLEEEPEAYDELSLNNQLPMFSVIEVNKSAKASSIVR